MHWHRSKRCEVLKCTSPQYFTGAGGGLSVLEYWCLAASSWICSSLSSLIRDSYLSEHSFSFTLNSTAVSGAGRPAAKCTQRDARTSHHPTRKHSATACRSAAVEWPCVNLRACVRACGVMATVVSWLLQRHAACQPAWPQQTLRAAASRPERTHGHCRICYPSVQD